MYIEISLKCIKRISGKLLYCEQQLKQTSFEIEDIASSFQVMEGEIIQDWLHSLKKQREKLLRDLENIRTLRIAIERIGEIYGQCEEELLNFEDAEKINTDVHSGQIDFLELAVRLKEYGINL